MPCWATLTHFCWDFRYSDPQQERDFQERGLRRSVRLCFWWCAVGGLFALWGAIANRFMFRHATSILLTLPSLVTAILFLGSALGVRFSRPVRRHVGALTAVLCLALVATTGWSLDQLVALDALDARDSLLEVLRLIEGHPSAVQTLDDFIFRSSTSKTVWFCMVFANFYLFFLLFFNYTKLVHLLYFSMPAMLLLYSLVNPSIMSRNVNPLLGSFLCASYASAASVYIALLRRREFQADYARQQSLAKEARAMQELALRESQHKESAQEADSILNHSLKNMMADAAGCIHMYAATLPGPLPADLALALACLDRGMGWCRKRQALLRVAAGQYVPTLTAVHLPEMGRALVRGRDVACTFADATVTLDAVLCELILDNGLNNAFRHGHPHAPAVHFSISLSPTPGSEKTQLLIFEVMNCANPDRPVVTPDLVEQLVRGDAVPCPRGASVSEHLGLQHMFMAAQAQNMALTLVQDGNVVLLQGTLEVAVETVHCAGASVSCTTDSEAPPALPPGTRILCVDDSTIACRLLSHTFRLSPSRPVVRTFGETPQEVAAFLSEAGRGADIVILDQHLDYGPVHYLGTDLLQQLVNNGYTGLICIRSANVAADNHQEYIEMGAHCAIGKDVSPKELVGVVCRAYARHLEPPQPPALPTPAAAPPPSSPSVEFARLLSLGDVAPGGVADTTSEAVTSES
eukprot:EG_transcript_5374